jgi:hypothetical protein
MAAKLNSSVIRLLSESLARAVLFVLRAYFGISFGED